MPKPAVENRNLIKENTPSDQPLLDSYEGTFKYAFPVANRFAGDLESTREVRYRIRPGRAVELTINVHKYTIGGVGGHKYDGLKFVVIRFESYPHFENWLDIFIEDFLDIEGYEIVSPQQLDSYPEIFFGVRKKTENNLSELKS
jgi:hypothetical protein